MRPECRQLAGCHRSECGEAAGAKANTQKPDFFVKLYVSRPGGWADQEGAVGIRGQVQHEVNAAVRQDSVGGFSGDWLGAAREIERLDIRDPRAAVGMNSMKGRRVTSRRLSLGHRFP